MKNRWLLNIGLVLLTGALALFVIYKPGAKQKPAGPPLTALTADAVQRIRLIRPRQPEIVLERSGDAWRLSAPRKARANSFRANELARLSSTPVKARFPAPSAGLGTYGLDHPLATVFLNEAEIRFGSMHPLNNEVYVLHDDQVQLIPARFLRSALAPLAEMLSTSLLEEKTKIFALRFPGFSVQQNEQGAWTRVPERKGLSSDRINRFVDEWRYARALSVAPYSGKPAKERVTLTVADGNKPRNLELGVLALKPEFIVVRRDENIEYHFTDDIGERLMQLKPDEAPPGKPAP